MRVLTGLASRLRRVFAGTRRRPPPGELPDDVDPGVGVREPRRPRPSPRNGSVALEPPPEELPPPDAVGG